MAGRGITGRDRRKTMVRADGAAGLRVASALLLSLCLIAGLAGCGTNIKWLLAKEADGAWENDTLTQKVERLAPEALGEVRAAEDAKFERCRRIDEAVQERLDQVRIGFWEQFLADLKLLGALLLPVPFVERCADAHEDYDEAILKLRKTIAANGWVD